jgi:hypothetical protein
VVVADGETLTEPLEAVTPPTPLSIEAVVALLLDQPSVVEPPVVMLPALAEKDPLGPGTVTEACAVVEPPGPLAVSV